MDLKKASWLCVLTAALVAASSKSVRALVAQALTGGSFSVPATGVNAGSGISAGGALSVSYTIGPPSAQPMTGGGFSLQPGVIAAADTPALNLSEAHAFPTPFKPSLGHDHITFTKLTRQATIDVYTVAGRLVKHLDKNDDTDVLSWGPVANEQGSPLASGVYLFVIHEPGTGSRRGKIMVIR